MKSIEFRVDGTPVGQPRPRACIRGKHAGMYDPGTAKAWKQQVKNAATVAFAKAGGFDEGIPLSVRLVFGMLRPKAHFKSIYVRPNAPKWHTSKPDADNLAKAVLDALVDCKVIDDDKRVALLYASKSYSTAAGCQITIGELE